MDWIISIHLIGSIIVGVMFLIDVRSGAERHWAVYVVTTLFWPQVFAIGALMDLYDWLKDGR